MRYLILINQFLWGGPVLILLLSLHLYYTWHLRFVQRKIGAAVRLSLEDSPAKESPAKDPSVKDPSAKDSSAKNPSCRESSHGKKGLHQTHRNKPTGFGRFGSLATTLAATLGTGNIVGVSTAVFLGGPGAVFWCWLTGALGMATTYAETWLCSSYRFRDHEGNLCSGPMYLLHHVLHKKWLALIYSAALCLSAFFIGCTTQSNALADTCQQTFGIPLVISSILTAFVVGLILMQGRALIERVSIALVPTMAIFFVGSCLLYLLLHASYIIPALKEILYAAFHTSTITTASGDALSGAADSARSITGLSPALSGISGFAVGQAVRYGIARGLFTNEAGLGTSGLIAGSSQEDNPHRQALVSMSASFWDTVVLCAITGVVLVAFQLEYPTEWSLWSAGSLLTGAFSKLPFGGPQILAVSLICFALATLIGWSYLGIRGFCFLFHGKALWIYHTLYIVMIFVGGILPLTLVWELTDLINLFLLIPCFYLLVKCRAKLTIP